MILEKVTKSAHNPIKPIQDDIFDSFEDIKKNLIALNNGLIPLPEGCDTIILDRYTSQVNNWDDKHRFDRCVKMLLETLRTEKLENLTYQIIYERQTIWITVKSL